MDEFREFDKYVAAVDAYGMQSGIVLIDPPQEWYVHGDAVAEHLRATVWSITAELTFM